MLVKITKFERIYQFWKARNYWSHIYGSDSNCRKCNLQFTFTMYDVGIRKKTIRLRIKSPKSKVHYTVVENVAFFSIFTRLRSALKVSNLDFLLCQFHKKVNNKIRTTGFDARYPHLKDDKGTRLKRFSVSFSPLDASLGREIKKKVGPMNRLEGRPKMTWGVFGLSALPHPFCILG